MNFLYEIIPERLINAIGWTIINSIWQGLFIGLILFAVLSFIPDKRSRLRYNISLAALSVLFLTVIFNFALELFISSGFSENLITAVQNKKILTGNFSPDQSTDGSSLGTILIGFIKNCKTYLQTHFPLVIAFWLSGILFFSARFFGGFHYVKKMKYLDSNFVPARWQNKLNSFRYKLKLAKPVRLLESARVNVPVVIGFIKPVILVPVGMLTGFSIDEVESILAHELAHVVRNDYLINILQSVAEIILFYNPALWWISGTIRKEREKCCDDTAVFLCGDSVVFARALANLEQINTEKYNLALAINGKQNLVTRIKRLFYKQKGTTMIEKTFAAGIIAILLLTATVFASTINSNDIVHEKGLGFEPAPGILFTENKLEPVESNKNVNRIEYMHKSEPVTVGMDSSDIDGNIIITRKLTPEEKILLQKQENEFREQEMKLREQQKSMRIEEAKMREQEKMMRAQEEKMREQEKVMRDQEAKMQEQEKLMRIEEEKMREQEKKMRIEEEKMREEEKKMRVEEKKMRKIEKEFMTKLTALLIHKGIIEKGKNFSLKLNKDELFVNRSKQSDELQQQVKEIYETVRGSKLDGNSSFQITQETDN